MAQPLKEMVNRDSVGLLADGVAAAHAPFPRERFVTTALEGLGALELKDRIRKVSLALHETLALPFPGAAAVLREAATRVRLDMWSGWPATDFVGAYGHDHLDEAMTTLAVLTPYSTGEFAVRPYLDRYQDAALKVMIGWAESDDEHLRRLASEGSRSRLPWATRVRWLMEPGPTLPILDRLRDDPSEYVRRSVANHVNDIAKDHPGAALALLGRWSSEGGSHVERVVRHAVRGLIRAGHPEALALLGAAPGNGAVESFGLASDEVAVGDRLRFTVVVSAASPGPLLLKYAVRRDGSRRIFHLAEREAATPGQTFTVTKSHSFRPVTTRAEPPGPRELDVIVNGEIRATASFTLVDADPAGG
ncbi:DNA alkylation repair protein [Actinomadura rudentiformis]|uniref:DNA alkylation repair protein n=1 Tax=Actinomadura rudentiformis TaxID=359158 RepID=A0A6H9Z2S7_9ACTN|nr:DNA alkylation repair protein [Actinomadura rudentiformis]KAB2347497.1 DNA alkylation repair protein [Actinomadura rudentiformis]